MSQCYDAVVIGAGIHGAAVAQALATRGNTVLVLERSAVAGGTSSRSSKLIHGGLRYLENGQFGLVRECLLARSWLLRHAPELVRLVPFHIPIYRTTQRRPLTVAAGLGLYSLLTGFNPGARFRRLPRDTWDGLDGIATDGLQAVFQYWDAQTDDAALTRAVLASAQTMGAQLAVPASFVGADVTADGCEVRYEHRGQSLSCEAAVVVNAAGPWVNSVLAMVRPVQRRLGIDLVQGTHILLDGCLAKGVYYLEAPRDSRAVFVMPWQGRTLVGTTEKSYRGDPAEVRPTAEEKAYLLETVGHYFPAYRGLGEGEIADAFAGLRVLPAGDNAAFARSRDTILHPDSPKAPRVLTIYGGKLTAHRPTAERVVRMLAKRLPVRRPKADWRRLQLRPAEEM